MNSDSRNAFTLVEILIVVLLLSIVAMIVIPRATSAATEARDAALEADVVTLRRAVGVYKAEHGGRLPHLDENGAEHMAGLIWRLTRTTTPEAKLDPNGSCGPYIIEWPANPMLDGPTSKQVKSGPGASPRDDTSGWYYCTATGQMHVNTSIGAFGVDPL